MMFLLALSAAHVRLLLRIFAAFHADASFLSPLVAAALKLKVGSVAPLAARATVRPTPKAMHANAVLPAEGAEYLTNSLPFHRVIVPCPEGRAQRPKESLTLYLVTL